LANPNRGQIALSVGGLEYKLSFSVNSLCELEAELDLPIASIIAILQNPKEIQMKFLRALLWAGLQDHHDDVTLKQAGIIVTDMGIKPAMEAVGQAFRLAFPEPPKEAKAKPNPRKAGA